MDPSKVSGARKAQELPRFVSPQLATLVQEAPRGGEWSHEIKFDGYRALARIENGASEIRSRNDKDWTDAYGVLADELAALPVRSAMLDGEVVVQSPDGTTSFEGLRHLARVTGRKAAASGGGGREGFTDRLLYYVFDLLYLDGYDLLGAPLQQRRALLKQMLDQATGSTAAYGSRDQIVGDGAAVLEQACGLGLEGVVSKKTAGRYQPGVRGPDWVKTKCRHEQEFVVGGFTDPAGTRVGFGALLLGVNDERGLRYVSRVGTGFDDGLLGRLGKRLRGLEIDEPPFATNLPAEQPGVHWVRPELVAQVSFLEWTSSGGLRHPSFKGLREDKSAREVVAEVVSRSTVGADRRSDARPSECDVSSNADVVNGVTLTHPDRVYWPESGLTKRDLVDYYDQVAPADAALRDRAARGHGALPWRVSRSLPKGVRQGNRRVDTCFFYKHPPADFAGPFQRVMITESGGPAPYLAITEAGSLTALAQMGVLEIHIWGSTAPDIEHPDMLVFDLDPDDSVPWPAWLRAPLMVRELLRAAGLESFVKTTGGKGLHVVAPVRAENGWPEVRLFCKGVAEVIASQAPDRFVATMSKAKRAGKIYVDYVRNTRGSTSIAPYSTRARDGATVAVPLRWEELSGGDRPDAYTLVTLPDRLKQLDGDPWQGYFETARAQTLPVMPATDAGLGGTRQQAHPVCIISGQDLAAGAV